MGLNSESPKNDERLKNRLDRIAGKAMKIHEISNFEFASRTKETSIDKLSSINQNRREKSQVVNRFVDMLTENYEKCFLLTVFSFGWSLIKEK